MSNLQIVCAGCPVGLPEARRGGPALPGGCPGCQAGVQSLQVRKSCLHLAASTGIKQFIEGASARRTSMRQRGQRQPWQLPSGSRYTMVKNTSIKLTVQVLVSNKIMSSGAPQGNPGTDSGGSSKADRAF